MRQFESGDLVAFNTTAVGVPFYAEKYKGQEWCVIRYTKGGLVHIHLYGDTRKQLSVSPRALRQVIRRTREEIFA